MEKPRSSKIPEKTWPRGSIEADGVIKLTECTMACKQPCDFCIPKSIKHERQNWEN